MPAPRAPSRVETITFPVFGLSWYGNPADGTSIVACCGGGGSSKTGVFNKIALRINGQEEKEISTEDQVCVGISVYSNPITNKSWLVGAIKTSVVRYALPEGTLAGTFDVGDGTNAVATNAMADRLAVGCEKGDIHILEISDDSNDFVPLGVCSGHVKAVCAVAFSLHNKILVSSAKDGTARVWNYETQTCTSTLTCHVPNPNPKRPQQILVRGCAFGDLEGKVIYTVASARRGEAYLYRWISTGGGGQNYECQEKIQCSPCPISAMSLSADASLLALGGVDGTISLYNTETWKVLKKFKEVHELPVTCIAARPYATPLQGDDEGVVMHALSASADSKFAFLTMQRRGPKQAKPGGTSSSGNICFSTSFIVWMGLFSWVLYYVLLETQVKCHEEWNEKAFGRFGECVMHTVLVAPASRPGISVPPH